MRISGRNFDVTKKLFGNRQTYILYFNLNILSAGPFSICLISFANWKLLLMLNFQRDTSTMLKLWKNFSFLTFLNKTMLNFQTDTFTFMLKLLKNFSFLTSTTWDPNLILLSPSSAYLSRSKNIFSINIYYLKYS